MCITNTHTSIYLYMQLKIFLFINSMTTTQIELTNNFEIKNEVKKLIKDIL